MAFIYHITVVFSKLTFAYVGAEGQTNTHMDSHMIQLMLIQPIFLRHT